jgi:CysZ protein
MGLFRGMGAFFGGVAFVVGTPRLWLRALAPVLMAFVLTTALGAVGVWQVIALTHGVWGSGFTVTILSLALCVAAVVIALVLGVSLAQPLSGWALEGIVRAQQKALGLPRAAEPTGLAGVLDSFASAMLAVTFGIPIVAMLTLIGLVFPPATVATLPLKVLVAGVVLAWDLLDYPLAARGLNVGGRLRWCAAHWGAVVGFGLSATLLFAIPGLGLLALPCGVAGATRLVVGSEGARARPQRGAM